ncbi:uncharacterized protein LOC133859108 [Alnus glutinosa]|uniref:uncharacterized protein LOC133859108 n=1 Tax=Alnus glutinosa TaxID=3517 RepID=UPI002D78F709|nr:uncharacterized protein LOC133859108 [Alnus glutinosa]
MSNILWNGRVILLAVVVAIIPLFLSVVFTKPKQTEVSFPRPEQQLFPMATEIFGVKIEKNPPESRLNELGVRAWPTWEGSPSKYPWKFSATETMYLLEGKVKVYVDGHEESFELGAGDLVVFPKEMKVTWDVTEAVKKHYSLEK